jgi:hypothetical protein
MHARDGSRQASTHVALWLARQLDIVYLSAATQQVGARCRLLLLLLALLFGFRRFHPQQL